MSGPVTIVGSSLAGMVAAQALAGLGRQVLIVNPLPNWGGHLAGISIGALRFDGGMVLYEFGSFNQEPAPDLHSYDPALRNDCGRFVSLVRDYVQQRIPMKQTPDPAMWHDGHCLPDMIIGNRVDALSMLPPDLQQAMRRELHAAAGDPDRSLHASGKTRAPQFLNADFATVSLRNHGATFHESFIEPLCRKVLGVGTREILALYHRAAWLPLYWPETLLAQLDGRPPALPATKFHYPAAGSGAALVDVLRDELFASERVRIAPGTVAALRRKADSCELQLQDGTVVETPDLVWAHDLAALDRLAGREVDAEPAPRASVGLCFLAVPERELRLKLGTLFVPDPRFRSYRVTNSDACAGTGAAMQRLVVEFSAADSAGAPAFAGIAAELVELGVLETPGSVLNCGTKLLHKVLPLPDETNRRHFDEQRQRISDSLPSVSLIGPAAGFLAASFNDQIVQGLKIGAEQGDPS